jgi:hypothetical protein
VCRLGFVFAQPDHLWSQVLLDPERLAHSLLVSQMKLSLEPVQVPRAVRFAADETVRLCTPDTPILREVLAAIVCEVCS